MLAGSLESATCVSPKVARLIYIIYIMRSGGLRAAFDGFCGGFALVSCLEPGWLCRLLEYFGCHLQASKTRLSHSRDCSNVRRVPNRAYAAVRAALARSQAD